MYLGILAVIEIAICIGLGLIQAFVCNVIAVESGILSLISGIVADKVCKVHPAIAVVIGIAVFVILLKLQYTKIGFWTIGIIMSFLWAVFFAVIAHDIPGSDMIWTHVTFGLSFLAVVGLHIYARDY